MTNEQLLPIIHKVMDKLMNLGGADYDSDKNTSKEQSDQGLIARDFGIEEWDWPQGVGLYGLLRISSRISTEITGIWTSLKTGSRIT